MEIKDFLESKINNINSDNYYQRFKEIADELIYSYCIECGEEHYRFAEIEFYYYDKNVLNKKWNEETYPRTGKETGTLFFHYSGFDICFPSSYETGRFGGILIRSLLRESDMKYINGPLLCTNEILNSCSLIETWPIIKRTSSRKCCIDSAKRFGIESDKNISDTFCFYDTNLIRRNRFVNASWDYNIHKPKDIVRNYTRPFSK